MKKWTYLVSMMVASVLFVGMTCVAQEESDVPFTWKGEGKAAYVTRDGELEDMEFDFTFNVDSEGWVTGTASTEGSTGTLEKFYYGPSEEGVRPLTFVLATKESDNPLLIIMQGKLIKIGEYSKRAMIYGETYVRPYETNGEIEKGLGIGDKTATEIYEDYMPSGLKKALAASKLIGVYRIIGKMTDE